MDITVLSSKTDAIKEGFGIEKGNVFVETSTGQKMLYISWTPSLINEDAHVKSKLKQQIKKFVSASLQFISSNLKNGNSLETIMFLTTEWEHCSNKTEFASGMIDEIRNELEKRTDCRWRILFVFSKENKQQELYKAFKLALLKKSNEKDPFAAISIPITGNN